MKALTQENNMTNDERRTFMKKAGLAALAAAGGMTLGETSAAQYRVPFSSGTELPKLRAPAGATDCHIHFYDDRFPAAASATLRPPNATIEDYRLFQQRIGTSRTVIVTPSTYGTDNRPSLEAAAKLGGSARVVAVVDNTVSDAELQQLADHGVRGIRFNLVQKGATSLQMLELLAERVHDLGWHVQIHMLGDQILQAEDMLGRLPVPIVFDHLGRVPQPAGINHPSYKTILTLVDKGRAWVKVSGAYHDSKVGPPDYADTSAVARAFIKAAPERMIWGSDWPHPTVKELASKPDDAVLFDLLTAWTSDTAIVHKVLVENPQKLYGFA
jgi:D-galactarolactone isomerase